MYKVRAGQLEEARGLFKVLETVCLTCKANLQAGDLKAAGTGGFQFYL